MNKPVSIFWFRRDLRLDDNHGFYQALKGLDPVVPVFIFDTNILEELTAKKDRRVEFIRDSLQRMQLQLEKQGARLDVRIGDPATVYKKLLQDYTVKAVYANHDYEPYALERDQSVQQLLQSKAIPFHSFKDQVILEKNEVVKDDGKPYTVFTPYSRRWKAVLRAEDLQSFPSEKLLDRVLKQTVKPIPSLEQLGFAGSGEPFPETSCPSSVLKNYKDQRDIPSVAGTSRLGVHLRFGTISIRALARQAQGLSETFLNELIWRDFYQMILWHFPQVVSHSFKPAYDAIPWRNNQQEFEAWCAGQTGYPIVDAGMRELNATGYMHNRVRMIVASFLTKHLLIDWRWGEAYFAQQLLDFDLAANNGGWQWAAGSGCDAAPYFRVFNPYLQTKKFDPDLLYIKKWVPEFQELTYVNPIVEHEFARARCLQTYGSALKK